MISIHLHFIRLLCRRRSRRHIMCNGGKIKSRPCTRFSSGHLCFCRFYLSVADINNLSRYICVAHSYLRVALSSSTIYILHEYCVYLAQCTHSPHVAHTHTISNFKRRRWTSMRYAVVECRRQGLMLIHI